jgi:hypothetical protein
MLVQSGDLHSGHYFARIKPDRNTRLCNFDNDRVTPVTNQQLLKENYSAAVSSPQAVQRTQVRAIKRCMNTYMRVYICKTVSTNPCVIHGARHARALECVRRSRCFVMMLTGSSALARRLAAAHGSTQGAAQGAACLPDSEGMPKVIADKM